MSLLHTPYGTFRVVDGLVDLGTRTTRGGVTAQDRVPVAAFVAALAHPDPEPVYDVRAARDAAEIQRERDDARARGWRV